jgi:hypothetical protein
VLEKITSRLRQRFAEAHHQPLWAAATHVRATLLLFNLISLERVARRLVSINAGFLLSAAVELSRPAKTAAIVSAASPALFAARLSVYKGGAE